MSVLIDTWWNVNKSFDDMTEQTAIVLIDTWWNVNYDSKCSNLHGHKF